MNWKGHLKNALFALALAGLIAPQAQAIEVYTGASPATHLNDDLITQVRGGGRGGMRHGGGMHRGGGMHAGMHRVAACIGVARMAACTGRAERMQAVATSIAT
jgi:hypothetical protein